MYKWSVPCAVWRIILSILVKFKLVFSKDIECTNKCSCWDGVNDHKRLDFPVNDKNDLNKWSHISRKSKVVQALEAYQQIHAYFNDSELNDRYFENIVIQHYKEIEKNASKID